MKEFKHTALALIYLLIHPTIAQAAGSEQMQLGTDIVTTNAGDPFGSLNSSWQTDPAAADYAAQMQKLQEAGQDQQKVNNAAAEVDSPEMQFLQDSAYSHSHEVNLDDDVYSVTRELFSQDNPIKNDCTTETKIVTKTATDTYFQNKSCLKPVVESDTYMLHHDISTSPVYIPPQPPKTDWLFYDETPNGIYQHAVAFSMNCGTSQHHDDYYIMIERGTTSWFHPNLNSPIAPLGTAVFNFLTGKVETDFTMPCTPKEIFIAYSFKSITPPDYLKFTRFDVLGNPANNRLAFINGDRSSGYLPQHQIVDNVQLRVC